MTCLRASRGLWVLVRQATLVAATLLVVPAATSHAWPVSPAVEPAPCEAGQNCPVEASASHSPQGANADATGGTSASTADAPPAAEAATVVSPATAPPSAATTAVPPVADTEQPRAVTAPPSSDTVPVAATPEVVPPRLIMFDVGLHLPVGKGSDNYYPGLRAGMLLGGRLGPQFSGNAELVIDLLNPDTPEGVSVTELFFDLTFSPFFHVPVSPTAQFILGPRLGLFYFAESVSLGTQSATGWGWGWAWGANAGFLATQSTTRVGFLASFNARTPEKFCSDTPSSAEQCFSKGLNTAKMLSLAFLVML